MNNAIDLDPIPAQIKQLPRTERMAAFQKIALISGNELIRLYNAHHRGDDSFQKEFLPSLWVQYQTHFPTELVKACRQHLDPKDQDLIDQEILEKFSPRSWDWGKIPQCVEPKLAILKAVHILIQPHMATSVNS
ncbi:MAG: hypothetical protein V1810_05255 [Candidatus Beckwithbacteria bacterium]